MKRIWFQLAVWLLLFVSVSPSSVLAAKPQGTEFELTVIETNGEVNMSVRAERLQDLYAFELQLEFDPLRFQLVRANTEVTGFTLEPWVNGRYLQLAHTKIGSAAGLTGDAGLAVFTFKRIRGGDALVTLKEVQIVDSSLDKFEFRPTKSIVSADDRTRIPLTDMIGHWAEERIRTAVELGFVTGYEDGTFRPNQPITRAEFATLMARALLLAEGTGLAFGDEKQIPSWAQGSVAAAAAAGLVTGYDDGTFRADRLINRSEMAVMAVRALKSQPDAGTAASFADGSQIPQWAQASVKLAVDLGMLQGRGGNRFAPLAETTRAEATSLILELLYKNVEL